jgi:hypothetical protein
MKKFIPYSLVFTILAAGSVFAKDKVEVVSNVTIAYKDSDKFTDARSSFGFGTDQGYLDTLSDHLKSVAAKHLTAGQKLEVTITDVDLAGEYIPTSRMDQVRIVKDIYRPRITLNFKVTDASGKVVKEGERTLTDLNFMSNISLIGRNEPLFYDKALLTDWVRKEFKS